MKPKRKTTIIERVEIVDRMSLRAATFDRLFKDGFRVTHSGTYTTKAMFPEINPDWFMLTAERIRLAEPGLQLKRTEGGK